MDLALSPATIKNVEEIDEEVEQLSERCIEVGKKAGLSSVGITTAEPFTEAQEILIERKEVGYAANMQFTYRNPERSTTPTKIISDAQSLVVGAMHTPAPRLPESSEGDSRISAYARKDYYSDLRNSLKSIAELLESEGWKARVVADDNALVDRAAAVRAGLGWVGKNSNVLLPKKGSWFVLGSVVTNAPLNPNKDVIEDECGKCTRCMDLCPTGAIVEPGVVDARRCIAWLVQAPGSIPLEFRTAVGNRLYGCDDCQEVCPVGRHEREKEEIENSSADIPALELLSYSDEEILDRYGHWYIAERNPKYLRRNALVVLGNSKKQSPDIEKGITKYLSDSDQVLKEHAEWAYNRRRTL